MGPRGVAHPRLQQHLGNTYWVPGSLLGAGAVAVNKTMSSRTHLPVGGGEGQGAQRQRLRKEVQPTSEVRSANVVVRTKQRRSPHSLEAPLCSTRWAMAHRKPAVCIPKPICLMCTCHCHWVNEILYKLRTYDRGKRVMSLKIEWNVSERREKGEQLVR